jgi:hypothetical protein
MNIFQSLNITIFGFTVVAILWGIANLNMPLGDISTATWLFLCFYLLLRLKTFFDDHKYFGSSQTSAVHFKLGVLAGFASWILWALSGYNIGNLQNAYFFIMLALAVSTFWIVVVAIRAGAYKEQYYWLGTNALYLILLLIMFKRNLPKGDWVTWGLSALGIIIVFIDFFISKSIPILERKRAS